MRGVYSLQAKKEVRWSIFYTAMSLNRKTKLHEHITNHINDIVPGFDISETTDVRDDSVPDCYWTNAYRHLRYIPTY